MRGQLLDAECNTLAVVVEVQNHNVQALVHFDHLFWVIHAAPAEVCDVYKAVDTTEVHEHTIRGDVLDHAFEDLTLLQAGDDLALLLLQLGLDERLVGNHDILVLLVDLDNLEFHLLAHVLIVVTDRLHVDLASRQECLDAEHVYNQAAFCAALDGTHDDLIVLHR